MQCTDWMVDDGVFIATFTDENDRMLRIFVDDEGPSIEAYIGEDEFLVGGCSMSSEEWWKFLHQKVDLVIPGEV